MPNGRKEQKRARVRVNRKVFFVLVGGCGHGLIRRSHNAKSERIKAMSSNTTNAAKAGIGFGSALAITISWSVNKSILWAIIHGILSWVYVIFYAITRH